MRPKRLLLTIVLVALSVALWYLGKSETPKPIARPAEPTSGEAIVDAAPAKALDPKPAAPVAPQKPEEPAPKSADLATWELKIDDALRSNAETSAIAQVLLQQVPSMPAEGQFASARHIVNLMPDKDYLSVLPYVRNTRLDPGFQEVIVAESLNRPDSVKLPLLLAAAQTPQHPMAQLAKSTLGFLLDSNFGEDWAKWEAAIKEALAKQSGG